MPQTLKKSHRTLTFLSWRTSFHLWPSGGFGIFEFLLQLMMTSSGRTRFLSIPILGCSPRPRNNPGGSILKFPIRSLWPSITQNPYSFIISSFWSLIFYNHKIHNHSARQLKINKTLTMLHSHTSLTSEHIIFLQQSII